MPALSVLTAFPSRTDSGLMLAASSSRPVESMRRSAVECRDPRPSGSGSARRSSRQWRSCNVILAVLEALSALEVHLVPICVGDIDDAAVRMDVDRSCALARFDVEGIRQRVLHEERLATQHAVGLKLVGIEFVLSLDRNIDPRLTRVKIEMPRSEAQTARRRDRSEVCQRAVLECEELEGARVFGLSVDGVVAARDQDGRVVARRGAGLMGVGGGLRGEDAGIERAGLARGLAEGAVSVEPVHGNATRSVVGGEQVFA